MPEVTQLFPMLVLLIKSIKGEKRARNTNIYIKVKMLWCQNRYQNTSTYKNNLDW